MKRTIGGISLVLSLACLATGPAFGRGFGGGFRGGGAGFRGGSFGGYRGGSFGGGSFGGYRGGSYGGYRAGGAEGFRAGGAEGFRAGGVEGGRVGGAEGFRAGGVEGGRVGGAEGFRAGGAEGFRAGGYSGYRGSYGGFAGGTPGVARAGWGAQGGFANRNNVAVGNRIGNNNVNINNRVNNVNVNNVNRVGNFTNVNHFGGYYGGGWGGRSAYAGYHSGWVNGYWGGHYGGWGGYGYRGWGGWGPYGYGWGYGGLGLGLGIGLGAGIASWGLGSALYSWGYSSYYNPYYYAAPAVVVQQPVVVDQPVVVADVPYNYSQPIDTQATPPEQSVTDQAIATFDSARGAFKSGDYQQALQLTDQALAKLPNDSVLHEFRALVLFAQGKYDPAAASLYAVLTAGPGWDWTTLVGLYPSVDVYTQQLRALESYVQAQPKSAPAHFVLAYQYLSEGFTDQAIGQLKKVVALQPRDTLSPKLIRQFSKPDTTETEAAAATPKPSEVGPTVNPDSLKGTWTARPAEGTTITLTFKPDKTFDWKVTEKGQDRQFSGESTLGDNILTLAQNSGPAMVGRVFMKGNDQFTFKVVGDGSGDPGLTFTR